MSLNVACLFFCSRIFATLHAMQILGHAASGSQALHDKSHSPSMLDASHALQNFPHPPLPEKQRFSAPAGAQSLARVRNKCFSLHRKCFLLFTASHLHQEHKRRFVTAGFSAISAGAVNLSFHVFEENRHFVTASFPSGNARACNSTSHVVYTEQKRRFGTAGFALEIYLAISSSKITAPLYLHRLGTTMEQTLWNRGETNLQTHSSPTYGRGLGIPYRFHTDPRG